jgi:hypothetical protein
MRRTQTTPKGETPTVRLLHDVRGDWAFAGTVAPAGVHKAYMNQYGAVSVEATNGKLLGIRPHEMEWVEGKPSMWCCGDGNSYVIEPYEGDWTLDAFNKKATTQFSSNAEWPDCIKLGRVPNVSTDTHKSEEMAQAICNRLEQTGFGGDGEVFPIKTWVERVKHEQ